MPFDPVPLFDPLHLPSLVTTNLFSISLVEYPWIWNSVVQYLFMYQLAICMSSLEKYSDPLPCLIELCEVLLLSCMSSLYILDINSLSDIYFANIFSYSVGCLFILLMIFFFMQKLLSLLYSHLFLFLLPFLLVSDPKNSQQYGWQGAYCLLFFP